MKLSDGWVLVGAGMLMTCIGIGAMMSLAALAGWLLVQHDWRASTLIIGVAAIFLVLPAAWLVRDPPGHSKVAVLLLQAMAIGAYVFVDTLPAFYAAAIVFGLAYGGVMPLYAVLVRDAFGPRIMGTMFGAVTLFASLGMALGSGAGGFVFDTWGNYSRLYIGAFVIGLCAAVIALTFRPVREAVSLQPQQMQHA